MIMYVVTEVYLQAVRDVSRRKFSILKRMYFNTKGVKNQWSFQLGITWSEHV